MSDNRLETLLDEQEIRKKIGRYVRSMDRQDFDAALKVWHPNGKAAYEGAEYPGSDSGKPEAFMKFAAEAHKGFESFTHQITNFMVRVDGDYAESEAQMLQVVLISKPSPDGDYGLRLHTGRYLDKWSKREGVWGIDNRFYLQDMTVDMPISEAAVYLSSASSHNDRRDASYHFIDMG